MAHIWSGSSGGVANITQLGDFWAWAIGGSQNYVIEIAMENLGTLKVLAAIANGTTYHKLQSLGGNTIYTVSAADAEDTGTVDSPLATWTLATNSSGYRGIKTGSATASAYAGAYAGIVDDLPAGWAAIPFAKKLAVANTWYNLGIGGDVTVLGFVLGYAHAYAGADTLRIQTSGGLRLATIPMPGAVYHCGTFNHWGAGNANWIVTPTGGDLQAKVDTYVPCYIAGVVFTTS